MIWFTVFQEMPPMRDFDSLSQKEILALAISL